MKKFLSLLLALVMLFALGSTAFAAFPASGFKDVPKGAWYEEAVNFAKAAGLMNGVADDRFDPSGKVTRAMVVTVLYRLAESPSVSGQKNPFADVSNSASNWYRDPVIWAANNGVTDGVDAKHFQPNTPISREQMASMIIRFISASDDTDEKEMQKYLGLLSTFDPNGEMAIDALKSGPDPKVFGDVSQFPNGKNFHGYKDAASISGYARWNVLFCALIGIMTGDDKGNFRPKDTLTRAECAQTFLNLYDIGMSN